MCGRFALATDLNEIRTQFQAEPVSFGELRPTFNIAPMRNVPVVRYVQEAQARQLDLMKWGLVPSWAKDEKGEVSSSTHAQKPLLKSHRFEKVSSSVA
jgi:putative SOS response-associated peptidase YedK